MKILSTVLVTLSLCTVAIAADTDYRLTLKNHRFEPSEIHVPAGQKIKLLVHNQDNAPEEFESHELNREKLVPPGTTAQIFIGPLTPGRYPFVGEFNDKTAHGVVIAE